MKPPSHPVASPVRQSPFSRGRFFLIAVVLALGAWIFLTVLLPARYFQPIAFIPWQTWPPFHDLRILLTACELFAQGGDPIASASSPYNYPPVWLGLAALGMTSAHTLWAGLTIVAFFLLGLSALLWAAAGQPRHWAWIFLVVTPPVLTAMERGNNDLIIFLLILAAGAWVRGRFAPYFAAGLIALATVLKLYPLAAFAALPEGLRRRQLAGLLLLVACLLGLYAIKDGREIWAASTKTPLSSVYSYGVTDLLTRLQDRLPDFASRRARALALAGKLLRLSAVVLTGACFFLGLRRAGPREDFTAIDARHWRWYCSGSAIYVATYLLLISWHYRLIFLLLCIPVLQELAAGKQHRTWALCTLGAVTLVLWGVAWPKFVPFLIVQVACLVLACLLAYGLGRRPPVVWSAWFGPAGSVEI